MEMMLPDKLKKFVKDTVLKEAGKFLREKTNLLTGREVVQKLEEYQNTYGTILLGIDSELQNQRKELVRLDEIQQTVNINCKQEIETVTSSLESVSQRLNEIEKLLEEIKQPLLSVQTAALSTSDRSVILSIIALVLSSITLGVLIWMIV